MAAHLSGCSKVKDNEERRALNVMCNFDWNVCKSHGKCITLNGSLICRPKIYSCIGIYECNKKLNLIIDYDN